MTEEFNPLSLAEVTAATAKEKADKVDPMWKDRIATLSVGGGFLIKRVETETQRNLKTRIDRAAKATGRKLTWYPQSGTLPDGNPGSYVVKVTAIDVAPQNAQNGTVQAQQTTNSENSTTDTSTEETASVGRVRGR